MRCQTQVPGVYMLFSYIYAALPMSEVPGASFWMKESYSQVGTRILQKTSPNSVAERKLLIAEIIGIRLPCSPEGVLSATNARRVLSLTMLAVFFFLTMLTVLGMSQ